MPNHKAVKQPQLCDKKSGEYPTTKETQLKEAKSRIDPAVTGPAGKSCSTQVSLLGARVGGWALSAASLEANQVQIEFKGEIDPGKQSELAPQLCSSLCLSVSRGGGDSSCLFTRIMRWAVFVGWDPVKIRGGANFLRNLYIPDPAYFQHILRLRPQNIILSCPGKRPMANLKCCPSVSNWRWGGGGWVPWCKLKQNVKQTRFLRLRSFLFLGQSRLHRIPRKVHFYFLSVSSHQKGGNVVSVSE